MNELPEELKEIAAGLQKVGRQKDEVTKALSKRFDKSRPKAFDFIIKHSNLEDKEDGKTVSKGVKAQDLIMQNVITFYHTSENQAYAKIPLFGKEEIVSTASETFIFWVMRMYSTVYGGLLKKKEIKEIISNIDAIAYMMGYKREIYVRIAEVDNTIYLDLCNENNEVLKIDESGFEVLSESPVLFRRTPDMAEIPKPVLRDKLDYKLLLKYLNVSTMDDFNMIVAFLLGALKPNMPKPILNFTGEAGSGKSMNTRLVRMFSDPAIQKDLLKKEIENDELTTSANSQYLLAFDNLSGISAKGSDLLCVVSTGGVVTKRKLYSDTDEVIVNLKKVVILNGIDDIAKRQDLVSRCIFIQTPRLKDEKKRTEAEIWKDFNADYPYILGSLINAVSVGIKNRNKDKSSYPRMIDFGRFVQNSSSALDWDTNYWRSTYVNNQNDGIEQSIDSDPFASTIIDLMEETKRKDLRYWRGTATELLIDAGKFLPPEETHYNRAWPKANQVRSRLRRAAPLLSSRQIEWEFVRTNGQNLYLIEIETTN